MPKPNRIVSFEGLLEYRKAGYQCYVVTMEGKRVNVKWIDPDSNVIELIDRLKMYFDDESVEGWFADPK